MTRPVRNLYELVPVRKRAFDENKDGTVDVLVPRYGEGPVGWILKRVFSNKPVRIHLDDIGTNVWRMCDGCRSVHEIGESLHEKFGGRVEPVYDRLELFLQRMRKSGLIDWNN